MRFTFGGQATDQAIQAPSANFGFVKTLPNVTGGTAWSLQTGGVQYTDFIQGGAPTSVLSSDSNGFVVPIQGPDEIRAMWVEFGGIRFLMRGLEVGFPGDVANQTNVAVANAVNAAVTGPGLTTTVKNILLTDADVRAASKGATGNSAYQDWLTLSGNAGKTLAQYQASLVGASGTSALSVYDYWLSQGNSGTYADYQATLVGPKGDAGPANTGYSPPWDLTLTAGFTSVYVRVPATAVNGIKLTACQANTDAATSSTATLQLVKKVGGVATNLLATGSEVTLASGQSEVYASFGTPLIVPAGAQFAARIVTPPSGSGVSKMTVFIEFERI